MVRINLLPQKREQRRAAEAGGSWILAIVGAVVVEVVILLFVHKSMDDELVRVQRENLKVQASIDDIKRQMANHAEIKAQLKQLKDREDAITKLQDNRSGPTNTLLELSRILSAGRGPTAERDKLEQLRRDNPQAAPKSDWDPRRVWLTGYSETNRYVKLSGLARDADDVSEIIRRLNVSDYFSDVHFLPATVTTDPETKVSVVRFDLSARVKY